MVQTILKFFKRKALQKIIIIVIFVAFIVTFLLGGSYKEVINSDAIYEKDNNSNVPYVTNKVVEEAIALTMDENTEIKDIKTVPSTDGGYKLDINLAEITQQVIDTLNKNEGRLEYYFSYGHMQEYLEKMIKAELVTQYPDLRSANKIGTPVSDENEFQGVIRFVRHKADDTNQILQYIPLGNAESTDELTLYGKINIANQTGNVSGDILNYFSIDTDGNLIVVKSIKTNTKSVEGSYQTPYKANEELANYTETDKAYLDVVPDQVSYRYVAHSINYRTTMEQYTMPFEYLWAFLVTGRDEKFISDIADLVLKSEIEVGIYDGQTINEELTIESYNTNEWSKNRRITRVVSYDIDSGNYQETYKNIGEWSNPATIITTHNYVGNYTKTTTDILTIKVTKADIWYMEGKSTFTKQVTEPSNPGLANIDITRHTNMDEVLEDGNQASENIQYIEGVERQIANAEDDTGITTIRYIRDDILKQTKKNQHMTAFASNSSSTDYVAEGTPQIKEKTNNTLREGDEGYPNFSTIYLESISARNNINKEKGGTEWLFEVLANNETTANMVELTKYMLYCATGMDFGVKTYEFELYNIADFTGVGTSSEELFLEYLHYWESSGNPPTNADGTKYIIHDDGAGHPTVGNGVDIENSGYKQEFIDAGYTDFSIGVEIDKGFVDSIEVMIIDEKTSGVEDRVSGLGLTDYQLNALKSRAYNCGVYGEPPDLPGALGPRNGKTFEEAYDVYWTEEDDLFEEKVEIPDFTHSLYVNYMDEPVTAKDVGYLPGLERRRKSEWALFQTGYYGYETNIDKWHPSGGAIVDAAYAVADHFMNSGVTVHYAGDDVNGATNNGRSCIYENIEGSYRMPIENPQRFGVVCATFVSLALRDAGIFSDDTINGYYYNSCGGVTSMLQDAGWQRITSYSELQPGDIWFEPGHVAIYVGDGKYIDQAYCVITSSGKDKRGQLRTANSSKFSYAYRYST